MFQRHQRGEPESSFRQDHISIVIDDEIYLDHQRYLFWGKTVSWSCLNGTMYFIARKHIGTELRMTAALT